MSLSGDEDVTIDDPSDSASGDSDGGSLIDASPPSSPVLGAAPRPAGRPTSSQPAPGPGSHLSPAPGPGLHLSRAPGPGLYLSPAPGTGSHFSPAPGPASHLSPAPGPGLHLSPAPGPGLHLGPAPGPASHLSPAAGPGLHLSPAPGPGLHPSPAPGPGFHLSPAPGPGLHLSSAPGPGLHFSPAPGPASHLSPAPGPASHLSPAPGLGTSTSTAAEPRTSAPPGWPVAPPGGPVALPGGTAAADGADAGERMDTAPGAADLDVEVMLGAADARPGADSDVEVMPGAADAGPAADSDVEVMPDAADAGPAADSDVEVMPDAADAGPAADSDAEVVPGAADAGPAADSDIEVMPVEDADPPRRGRAAARASGLWRETDFREAARGPPVERARDAGTEAAAQNPLPATARPPAADVISAAGSAGEHKTPAKSEGGGFLTGGADVRSPASEDGQCCTICFESWSNSGEHRIASLRCGHLFGKSCIERWLRGREQRCPQCNAKASRRDVRVIFAKSLRVLDTTDRDRAMEELDRERETRRRLELDFAVVQVKCQMKENQIAKLQTELRVLRDRVAGGGGGGGGGGGSPQPAGGAAAAAKLSLQCSLEVSRAGGCRVLEHNSWLGMLVASQPSQNTLFPGHGVRKINTLDMRPLQFVSLHQKQIRDVQFSPEQRDLLLSVSLDRRAKITNVCGNTLVQTYECDAPVWSCAWDRDAPHTFYAGLQSGAVLAFDTRAGCEPLQRLDGGSPVVALRHVARGGDDASGGLLACRLADCTLQEVGGQRRCHALPLHGPFVSADFDERTRHLLVSSRPSSRQPHAQHTVCRLRRAGAEPVTAEVVQVFRGGTSQRVLSRSALVPHPLHPDAPLVCASQETAQLTQLWDLASGQCAATLAATEPVLDACPLTAQDRHFLALLTERTVKMYRWEVT